MADLSKYNYVVSVKFGKEPDMDEIVFLAEDQERLVAAFKSVVSSASAVIDNGGVVFVAMERARFKKHDLVVE